MGTWSYTILGNDDAMDFWGIFVYTCANNLNKKEYEEFGEIDNFEDIPLEDRQYIINKNFDKLLSIVKKDGSIDGYLTLGVFITENGGVLSQDDKSIILENIKDSEDKFFGGTGWSKRKKCFDEFRQKIINYDGEPQKFTHIGLFEKVLNHLERS